MDQIKTGKLIAKLRKDKGLTQQQLADIFGINYRSVSKWETGQTMPDLSNIDLLSEIFNVTRDELLKGELNPKTISKPKKKSLFTKNLLITFLLIIIIISITGLFIYHNSKSESYMLNSMNKQEYYVEGTVTFTNNNISVLINKLVFLDREFNKINIKWYQYELISNNNVIYKHNYSDIFIKIQNIYNIKDFSNMFTINYNNELKFDKQIYLDTPLTLRITFTDEFDNIIVKDITMNIVPKSNTTQEVE